MFLNKGEYVSGGNSWKISPVKWERRRDLAFEKQLFHCHFSVKTCTPIITTARASGINNEPMRSQTKTL